MIKSKEEFYKFVEEYWKDKEKPDYWGLAVEFNDSKGQTIAWKVLTLNKGENYGALAAIQEGFKKGLNGESLVENYFLWLDDEKFHTNVEALKSREGVSIVVFFFKEEEFQEKPENLLDAHVRLALLSRRIKKPNEINLDGIFSLLPNLVWTNKGPFSIQDWNKKFVKGTTQEITPLAIDKFPPFFLWNPVPTGVRVANTDMVRAGAYLAEGTTVMHYGFINFNAGTLGASMVEGRISAGTVVDEGTDIGAGAGFLGTLSGGNSIKMKTGKNCLVGAMAECGIPLGNNCTIAVGTTFAPRTPIYDTRDNTWKKAIELANQNNLLIWQNAKTGRLEVLENKTHIELNKELHKND